MSLQQNFQNALTKARKKLGVTGMAGMALQHGKIITEATDGYRKHGDNTPIGKNDKWHLGSITKSMTATLIGRLVEQGKLTFEDKLPDVMPTFKDTMHQEYHDITVAQLLLMRSGMTGNFDNEVLNDRVFPDATALRTARHKAVKEMLERKPEGIPGTSYIYSNAGYTTAGVIAELITGESWEDLLRKELFEPLSLTSAGFGSPYGDGPVDQPWPNQRKFYFWKKALDPRDPASDNSHIMGPAGIVHMSLQDLVRYGHEHIKGMNGRSDLLSQATFRQLHTGKKTSPLSKAKVSKGWVHNENFKPYNNQLTIFTAGSNTLFYVTLTLLPDTETVIAIAFNEVAEGKVEAAAMKLGQVVVEELVRGKV